MQTHVPYSDYSEVIVVGAGAEAVDYKLISLCHIRIISKDQKSAQRKMMRGLHSRLRK